jgi:hypothetical protein
MERATTSQVRPRNHRARYLAQLISGSVSEHWPWLATTFVGPIVLWVWGKRRKKLRISGVEFAATGHKIGLPAVQRSSSKTASDIWALPMTDQHNPLMAVTFVFEQLKRLVPTN